MYYLPAIFGIHFHFITYLSYQVNIAGNQLGYYPYTVTGHAVRAFDFADEPLACWVLGIPTNDLYANVDVSVGGYTLCCGGWLRWHFFREGKGCIYIRIHT